MKANFVLEIGVEDLPEKAGEYLEKSFSFLLENSLKENRIDYEDLKIFHTPRRIIIFLKNLQETQKEKITQITGPPLEICLDKNGMWNEIAIKFVKSKNANITDLKIFEKNGKRVIGIEKKEKGEKIFKILNGIINDVLKKMEIPRGMIWSENKFKFFRPIRYIFSLYGGKSIPFEIAGIHNKKFTYGHRVLSDEKIVPKNPTDYFDKILKNYVIFDQNLRRKMIEAQIRKIIKNKFSYKNEFIERVVNLIEYPICGICELPENYKKLPQEVLVSLILNVKGVPLFDSNNNLAQIFIVICDGIFNEKIKGNYEKVVESKIEDAIFFMEQDLIKKPFIEYLLDLKNILYHPKLGTVYDRVERIRKICDFISENLNLEEETKNKISLIVSLFKNDLATLMVSEFPSLQGV
ncbi:MAG: glycine--tRNA ligase subunit beta, partial [bacterium]|nr:glycine--tRNA ligase subunit beta [bacterium]MDW8163667.1 glycine--tRNA ligase subunit beta [Candidatus Omnitrophota bacterium]